MRGASSILVLVAVTALLVGCGEAGSSASEPGSPPQPKGPPREMTITLDGYAGPENVGVLMAHREKYFDDAGLKVGIYSPSEPVRPVMYTVDETVDVGISREPEVAVAQSEGKPVVAIGSLVSEPTAAMAWLGRSEIDGIADLKGKTIATAGLHMQKRLLKSVLASAGLRLSDVKLEDLKYETVSALAQGRVDAIFGAGWNLEGVQLEKMGLDPVITRVQDLGIPDYDEYVFIARRDRLEKEPALFADFMAAAVHGAGAAVDDPDLALKVIDEDFESDGQISSKTRRAQVEATLPLLSRSGEMDPAEAEDLISWMQAEKMIETAIPVSALLTNEYLP
jgi:putative hydroxymethylpyrimidine transport system substrate-binding protein